MAQTAIKTPADGLNVADLIPVAGGKCPATPPRRRRPASSR
jgi:hypothetical protein